MDDQEELDSINFIYDDTVVEYLIEDDEVRQLWRYSRSLVTRKFLKPNIVTLTPETFDDFVKGTDLGAITFVQDWDDISNTVVELLEEVMSYDSLPAGAKFARVSCVDWPKLCDEQDFTEYGEIRLIRHGNMIPWTGPASSEGISRALKLFSLPFPMELTSLLEVRRMLSSKILEEFDVRSSVVLVFPKSTAGKKVITK
ncbi:unnamed protein product [Cyprideis torosa]|uniref:Uncharacterized protein n=1 Tax=Cyprideis torosa TaxID=163714 RepID=A0A7R8WTZ4_9CRUS|nr:unnamed protein product [Cyprideis torosa]CAG0905152.1 unnamed protein product [Cyprideis torosa]